MTTNNGPFEFMKRLADFLKEEGVTMDCSQVNLVCHNNELDDVSVLWSGTCSIKTINGVTNFTNGAFNIRTSARFDSLYYTQPMEHLAGGDG